MRLSIFSRLTLGYLAMFVVIGGMNAFVLMKLDTLNADTARIINIDQRLLDLRKRLADSVLIQMGFEKKFVITGDPTFKQRFSSASDDFTRLLADALETAGSPEQKDSVLKVRTLYTAYHSIVRQETERAPGIRTVVARPGAQEKGRLVDAILKELNRLEESAHRDLYSRMSALKKAGGKMREATVAIWSMAFVLFVGTAFFTTRSVTKPMAVLTKKTAEVSAGVFEGNLAIGSPPEIAGLANAFNAMCDKLKRADEMKSEFFRTMSHELKTPLASIKEGVSLLRDGAGGPTTDAQKRLLAILSEETVRLIGLVGSLLDLIKMEEGMMEYHFADESLPQLAQRVVVEIGTLAEAKKIRVTTSMAGDIPPVRLDRERILQTIRNLVGNAAKFTPAGGSIRIVLRRDGKGVEFSVNDTGPGIPKENVGAIFEEFHTLPVRNSSFMKGTGLGLAIARQVITAHGGKIWVESEPGVGSTFFFVLPL